MPDTIDPTRRNMKKKIFFDHPPPRSKNLVKMKKIKVVPNWLKWRENWSEIFFGLFNHPPPPPPEKNLVNMKKNQICPNLAEMARKLVGNNFRVF